EEEEEEEEEDGEEEEEEEEEEGRRRKTGGEGDRCFFGCASPLHARRVRPGQDRPARLRGATT
ncbi:unnamed protein product, partial [Prorocentrum cordatum]